MRKSKKMFACLFVGVGVLFLLLSFIRVLPAAFMVATGSALVAWGIVSFLFEHFVHKVWRAKIMDEDERNLSINGKAYTLTSEFTDVGLVVLALYSLIYKSDMIGCIIAVVIFLLSKIVYAISFKYFDTQ